MRSALCLSVTVGVAFAGVAVSGPPARAAGIEVRGVDLAAGPADAYLDLVTNTVTNVGAIGARWLDDPLPAVAQLLTNWADYLHTTVGALVDTVQSFVDGLANLPGQLQTLFDAVTTGDFVAAVAMVIITVLSVNPALGLVDRLMGIPIAMVGNAVNAGMAILHAVQVPIGLSVLSAGQATFAEIGTVVDGVINDLSTGDFAAALSSLVEAPALILNAALNNDSPSLPGLLTPVADLSQTGFLDAIVNYLPQAVAQAIGPDADALQAPAEAAAMGDVAG